MLEGFKLLAHLLTKCHALVTAQIQTQIMLIAQHVRGVCVLARLCLKNM
jgi:hypothetical protein